MHAIEHIIAAIAPHRCLSCGAEPLPLCHPCLAELPKTPDCCYKCARKAKNGLCFPCSSTSHLQSIAVRTIYAGLAESVVQALKFNRVHSLAAAIAASLAPLCPAGTIIPVPTAAKRVRQRGYDQAVLIARHVAKATGNPYQALLQRTGSQRQLGQSRAIRQKQLHDAFWLPSHLPDTSTPIVLIDDVMTTGSTFETAADTLKQAGFEHIHALAFAWADSRLANQ